VGLTGANDCGMAVCLTLVFSDEAHREAWMMRQEMLSTAPRILDYENRKGETNLYYVIQGEGGGAICRESTGGSSVP
jgi:hypothetical protein